MDTRPLLEAEILEVFDKLGLATPDDREKFLRMERLSRIEILNDAPEIPPLEVSFGGPAEGAKI